MNKQNKAIISFLLLALIFTSCGESGSGSTQPQVASGGIGGTGISQGTVTGFGSVILNGVAFKTGIKTLSTEDDSTFIIDDNQTGTTQGDLSIGMQVKVQVDATGKTAISVTYDPQVAGPLDAPVDTANNRLSVLGQTITVDDSTKIEDSNGSVSLTSLQTGDMIEVSGLVLLDNTIQATYIKKRDVSFLSGSTEVELKGSIASVKPTSKTFTIAGLTINYSSESTDFDEMSESELAVDLFVEVKGTLNATGTTITASRIQKEDDSLGSAKLEIEGMVTKFFSFTDFSVSGQAVSTNSSTDFEDGARDDLDINVRLEVEGKITNGVLVASKVKFHGNRIKIHADVTDFGSLPNSVTLLGKTVVINGSTDMRDKTKPGVNPFDFGDISDNDHLEIRGYLSEGVITATRVERQDPDSNILLQAPVQKISGTELTLLGLTVKTDGASFEDEAGGSISPSDFFSQIKVGSLVKVRRGTISGSIIIATEMEIED